MKFQVHSPETNQLLKEIKHLLIDIRDNQTKQQQQGAAAMASIEDLQAEVAQNTDVTASAVSLIQGLSQQLKDALAANDPAAIQAVVDQLDANSQSLAEAVANVPHPEQQ